MATSYPIIANCNYESAGHEGRAIDVIRRAIDKGLTDDTNLIEAMDVLEAVLAEHAESGSERSVRACQLAEAAVLEAWTDEIADAVRAEQQSRYID